MGPRLVWSTVVHPPASHPSAPQEIKDHYDEFVAKIQATLQRRSGSGPAPNAGDTDPAAKKSTGPAAGGSALGRSYNDFWEVPARYQERLEMTPLEEEAIMSGGATLR